MRILIVSALGLTRHSIQQIVQRDGHRTSLAETVDRAVEVIRVDSSIDLVIAEWHISRATARELYQQCQRMTKITDEGDALAPPKFLVITTPTNELGKAQETSQNQASIAAMQFADVMAKPLDRLQLLGYLRAIEIQQCQPAACVAKEGVQPVKSGQLLLEWGTTE